MRRYSSSVQDDLLRTPVEYDIPRRKDNLFLWTVFLLLLVGVCMVCWIGCYLVFNRPELPVSYKLLRKIKKITPPQRYQINAAPQGEFLTPEKLYSRYKDLSSPALREINRNLERNYLRNYPLANDQVPYVTGRFTIMDSYELGQNDFVPSGVVSLAVSTDFPKILIEHIYSASPQDAPIIKRNLQTGMDIELRRTFELTAVIHVTKLTDGRIQLTVVPLNYGRYLFTGTNGGFELQPPNELNVAAGWPIVRTDRYKAADEAYVNFRMNANLRPAVAKTDQPLKRPLTALKGVDLPASTPTSSPPLPTASPALVASAAPPPKPGQNPATKPPVPTASASPALVAEATPAVPRAVAVETPRRVAPTPALAVRAAQPGQTSSGGVSLQPFLPGQPTSVVSAPPAAIPVAPRTWTTYAPGRAPSGKNVQVNEIAALSTRGALGGEPVYLTGQFVVRAVGENKLKGVKNAVMRSSSDSNVRVIVEYPGDRSLPSEGAEINRDDQRPYLVTDVRRVGDGTLNVYAREITEP